MLIAGGPCAAYSASPTPAEIKECNSWLGPNQPGVNAPESTPSRRAASRRAGTSPAAARGRQRSTGEPEAPPTPGERDICKPQVTLPDGVRKLLDDLRGPRPGPAPQVPSVPEGESAPNSGLLDYLLAP